MNRPGENWPEPPARMSEEDHEWVQSVRRQMTDWLAMGVMPPTVEFRVLAHPDDLRKQPDEPQIATVWGVRLWRSEDVTPMRPKVVVVNRPPW